MIKVPWWRREICDDTTLILVILMLFAVAFGSALVRWAVTQ